MSNEVEQAITASDGVIDCHIDWESERAVVEVSNDATVATLADTIDRLPWGFRMVSAGKEDSAVQFRFTTREEIRE